MSVDTARVGDRPSDDWRGRLEAWATAIIGAYFDSIRLPGQCVPTRLTADRRFYACEVIARESIAQGGAHVFLGLEIEVEGALGHLGGGGEVEAALSETGVVFDQIGEPLFGRLGSGHAAVMV